jgi:hypothetical protein
VNDGFAAVHSGGQGGPISDVDPGATPDDDGLVTAVAESAHDTTTDKAAAAGDRDPSHDAPRSVSTVGMAPTGALNRRTGAMDMPRRTRRRRGRAGGIG